MYTIYIERVKKIYKNFLKLPILTLVAGIILRVTDYIIVYILVKGSSEFTLEMGTLMFYIRLILSIAAFVIIGMILRQKYDRTWFLKSTTILVLYSIIILATEQLLQYFATYSILIYWLYLPVEIFTIITSVLARISTASTITWLYAIPSVLAPYLFVLFSKRSIGRD